MIWMQMIDNDKQANLLRRRSLLLQRSTRPFETAPVFVSADGRLRRSIARAFVDSLLQLSLRSDSSFGILFESSFHLFIAFPAHFRRRTEISMTSANFYFTLSAVLSSVSNEIRKYQNLP